MTILDIVEQLTQLGYEVEYKKRSDSPSIRITSISGTKYKGSTGNTRAREIVGASKWGAKKTTFKKQRVKEPEILDDELTRALKRAQYQWRKHPPKVGGKLTKKKLRELVRSRGKEEALQSLDQATRYAMGYAYDKNIDILLERIGAISGRFKDASENQAIQELYALISSKRGKIREDWIQGIYSLLYEVEKKQLSAKDALLEIKKLIA